MLPPLFLHRPAFLIFAIDSPEAFDSVRLVVEFGRWSDFGSNEQFD